MGIFLGLSIAVWAFGALMKVPVSRRWGVIGLLWAGVVTIHLVLPDGHPLRLALGGRAEGWLVLGGLAGFVLGYRLLLVRLRGRHEVPVAEGTPGAFRPAELERYSRHILLREIGGAGQRRLKEARVLVVGAGGLGSPVLLYLAASGVGVIGVIDDDLVENANLQRQVIHTDDRIGQPKVQSAMVAMRALNPFIEVRPYQRRLTADVAAGLFADYDLVLDGSDNFETRAAVNAACVAAGKPLIAGAITQWEGQVSLYHPAAGGPCYACVFPQHPAPGLVPTCAEAGVASPLPGVIGAMMAMEAIKHLTGAGKTLQGRLLIHDALFVETRVISVPRRADCAVCGGPSAAG